MGGRSVLVQAAVLVMHAIALTGCQTDRDMRQAAVAASAIVTLPTDVIEDATAPLTAQSGSRYPDLYDANSFAVLLSGDVLVDRLEAAAQAYRYPPAQVALERDRILRLAAEFIICELHLVSTFGDLGVATDAVSLRNMRATLADDTGRAATAAAIQAGASEDVETPGMATVMRTMLVFFPRVPAPGTPPLIQSTTQRLRLVLVGQDSVFAAEWALNATFQP